MDSLLQGVSPLAWFRLPRFAPLLLCTSLLSGCSAESYLNQLKAALNRTTGSAPVVLSGSLATVANPVSAPDPLPRSLALVSRPAPLVSSFARISVPGPLPRSLTPVPIPDPQVKDTTPVSVPGPLPVIGLITALAFCRRFRQIKVRRQRQGSFSDIP